MFGTKREVSQRPVRMLQYKSHVGAKWFSYLELALSVKIFLRFRGIYSIKMEFFEAATKFLSKLTFSHMNLRHLGASEQHEMWGYGFWEC